MQLQDIISAVQEYHPDPDIDTIRRAYAFARQQHQGQVRASGEPYITHVAEVAHLAARLKLDVASIVTALLHDTVEDTNITVADIEREFGKDVAELVDGVTKLDQVKFSSRAEEQAENFRKMLLAMARDIRVLLVKLCDRTHNMRTLEFLSDSRRMRIAQETLDIYAPLAHRLGIYWMKSELEDLSLYYLKPEIYSNIKQWVAKTKRERERYIDEVVTLLTREMEQNNIPCSVSGRPKHFYSIYQKMEEHEINFDEIYDLIAFRVIVKTPMESYAALGAVHAAWKPIPGRFKDYIAMPKPNNYQSLHTTVIGPRGARIEIQIRTQEMHDIAEKGIAAHWIYKESSGGTDSGKVPLKDQPQFTWLKNLVESEQMLRDPIEFLANVKEDLFPQEVFVFSPKGDVIALTRGSTPIDFAYHIHSEVGNHCAGARVNGQQVALNYRLQNGDTIEISTSPQQFPHKDWLKNVATTKARQRIRAWLRIEERSRSISVGRELLTKDLRKVKLNFTKLQKENAFEKVVTELGYRDFDSMLADMGYGKLSTTTVARKLAPDEPDVDEKLQKEDTVLQKIFQRAAKTLRDSTGIKINGVEDIVFRFAHCCEPLPGDDLVGFITRGRGVAIHKRGCPQTQSYDPSRFVPVSWDTDVKTVRRIKLRIATVDKVGLLAAMTSAISSGGANIVRAEVSVNPDGKAANTFEINVESAKQLDAITRSLEGIDGVIKVERYRKLSEDYAKESD